MLSQLKMNPDPAYQNRLLPERDNASFFDGYSVWFYKEQGDLQQANAFTLEFEIAPFGISSEGDAIFSCMDRKTSEGMAVRLTSDRKVEVILGFGGRQMVFYSIRENVDLEKWNHIFVIYRFREGWCDLVVNGVLSNRYLLFFERFIYLSPFSSIQLQILYWISYPSYALSFEIQECLALFCK